MADKKKKAKPLEDLAVNRKAWHDYTVLEKIECGIVLAGTEVKVVRRGEASLAGSYAAVLGGQLRHRQTALGLIGPELTQGHALAGMLGHTTTALYPSLGQLKTDTKWTKTLKGIRAQDCALTAHFDGEEISLSGDVIFTEYGLSGDAIFRLSAYVVDKKKVRVSLDFAPTIDKAQLSAFLENKRAQKGEDELLCGIVNNQIGRAIVRRAGEEGKSIASLVKAFELGVTGNLGFDYAQVTKGGVHLHEVTENMESKKHKGLYFTGEILDVDGACGGFNLQWAYSSACKVAAAINAKNNK